MPCRNVWRLPPPTPPHPNGSVCVPYPSHTHTHTHTGWRGVLQPLSWIQCFHGSHVFCTCRIRQSKRWRKRPLLSIHWLAIDSQSAAAHLPTANMRTFNVHTRTKSVNIWGTDWIFLNEAVECECAHLFSWKEGFDVCGWCFFFCLFFFPHSVTWSC